MSEVRPKLSSDGEQSAPASDDSAPQDNIAVALSQLRSEVEARKLAEEKLQQETEKRKLAEEKLQHAIEQRVATEEEIRGILDIIREQQEAIRAMATPI